MGAAMKIVPEFCLLIFVPLLCLVIAAPPQALLLPEVWRVNLPSRSTNALNFPSGAATRQWFSQPASHMEHQPMVQHTKRQYEDRLDSFGNSKMSSELIKMIKESSRLRLHDSGVQSV